MTVGIELGTLDLRVFPTESSSLSSLLSEWIIVVGRKKMERKRVVVVGGGVAGVHVAKALQADAAVTLVDPKDYFEVPYSALRSIVEPSSAERSIILYSEILTETQLLMSAAISASPTEVVTSTGDRLPYDYLVICTGSTSRGAPTRTERIQEFYKDSERLNHASTVLIVGGGPVGVELAGEIVTDFPEKTAIIVQSGDRLIDFLGPTASTKTLNWLRSKSVEVFFNERIDVSSSPPIYTTDAGRKIEADTHFICTGSKVNSSWFKDSFLESSVENGRLKVDSHLRVSGTQNIFAAGDITDTKEIKQGFLAEKHAKTIATNIKKLLKNVNSKLDAYTPLSQPMGVVSLGRYAAVAQLPFGTFVGRIPGLIKSRDLFVGKTRKGLGLK